MSLEKKIEEKLKESLKNKDKNVFPTLRLIISAIKDFKIASKAKLTAFDFNYRKNLHTNKIETQNLFKEINQFVDINFISYDDMIDIYGKTDAIDFVKKNSRKNNIILLRLHDHVIYSYYGLFISWRFGYDVNHCTCQFIDCDDE